MGTAGSFTLEFEGYVTAPIRFDASAAEVEAALDSLASVGGVGGSMSVTGGPGDETASNPYIVTFGGTLTGKAVALRTAPREQQALSGTQRDPYELWDPRVETPTQAGYTSRYSVQISNVGDKLSSGEVTFTDVLPSGVTTAATPQAQPEPSLGGFRCSRGSGQTVVTCTTAKAARALAPFASIEIPIEVSTGVSGPLTNRMEVSGGEGRPAMVSEEGPAGGENMPFAPLGLEVSALDPAGSLDRQAGDHPEALTTDFAWTSRLSAEPGGPLEVRPTEFVRQIVLDLPPGLVASSRAAPTCTLAELANTGHPGAGCPANARVGTLTLRLYANTEINLSLYNIVPEHGYPAELGVYLPTVQRAAVMYAAVVGSGADTHIRVTSAPLPEALYTLGVSATVFGDPARMDEARSVPSEEELEEGILEEGRSRPTTMFTNPVNCQASGFTTTLHIDSWERPGLVNSDGTPDFSDPNWKEAASEAPAVTGCHQLAFEPTFGLQPNTQASDAPTGLSVDLHIPQQQYPEAVATPELRDATVTLPEGMVVSASSANGLLGCTPEQIDVTSNDPSSCPSAAQIGTVTVETPLLEHSLPGKVFVGTPACSPCTSVNAENGEMVKLYIEINDPTTGVIVKLPGTVQLDPATGRLTATFVEAPQLPFEDMKLSFKSGPDAPLATPSGCGTYETTTDLRPWSAPETPDASPSSSFQIDEGCGGRGFAPSFQAGTTNNQAGAFSPLTIALGRQDSEQQLADLSLTLPSGALARLAGVPECPEELAASEAECPEGSQLGTVTVAAGPGASPYSVSGKVFLTGPYNGGPFGEVVKVAAVAGPFNLGMVSVRGSIRVNPYTAQASIVSDPFPTILDGIPLQVRSVDVDVSRPGFAFNPTGCEAKAVEGAVTSTQGANAAVSSPFEAANCATLPFEPGFAAATNGQASKAGGADLVVRVSSKGGPQSGGGEANIRAVKVDLPKQLPSRLTTLQKACLAAVFDANPAACPQESDVGMATAVTPLLSSPLTGPAYLVSHGGAAFPDLEIVLQGEGITLILDGKTDIKKGVTSSIFRTVPDAPISSFELRLPSGPYSVLASNLPNSADYSFCGQTLSMPTEMTGQNGVVVKQTTNIAVEGCSKKLSVRSHSVKRHTLVLSLYVPSAGRVTVSGKGLDVARKTAKGREMLTIVLRRKGRASTRVEVVFIPRKGAKQTKSFEVGPR